MNLTPAQVREVIDRTRKHYYQTYQTMEQYEAIVFEHPGMKYIPGTQRDMKEDLVGLRTKLRQQAVKAREATLKLEEMLAADEAANGWKGEDRFVEFCL